MTKHQIDCEQALKQVFEYIDHELADGERDAMQHHLHTCKSCFSRYEFERRLKEKLAQLPKGESEVPLDVSDRIKKLINSF